MKPINDNSNNNKVKLAINKIYKDLDELITELVNDNPKNDDLKSLYNEFNSIDTKNMTIFSLFKLLEKICAITKNIKITSDQKDKEFLLYMFSKLKIIDFNMLKNSGINEKQKKEIVNFESNIINDIVEVESVGKNNERDINEFKNKVIDNTKNIKDKVNSFITNQTLLIDEQEKNIKEQNKIIASMKEEMEKVQQKLDESIQSSFTDILTGLQNRRSFDEQCKKFNLLWNEKKSNLFYIIIDIDLFKNINDTYGHSTGDKVLSDLGKLFLHLEKTNDNLKCYRYGGEEFVISAQNMKYNDVLKLVRNLKESIAKRPFSYNDVKIPITISIGVSYFSEQNENSVDVFNLADQALYKAKEKRNSIYLLTDKKEKIKTIK